MIEPLHKFLVVFNFEAVEKEFNGHIASGVKILMDLECDVDQGH
jgi:hypothetical protein